MDNDMQNTIKTQLEELPAEVRQAIGSFDWALKVQEIGKKNGLHIDQLDPLEAEIALVIIGSTAPDDFSNQLKRNLALPEEKLAPIVTDANEMIFKPIREALVKIYEENLTDADLAETISSEAGMKSAGVEILNGTQPTVSKITQDKMMGTFHLPKIETDVSITKSAPEAKNLPTPGVMPKIDPYREKPL